MGFSFLGRGALAGDVPFAFAVKRLSTSTASMSPRGTRKTRRGAGVGEGACPAAGDPPAHPLPELHHEGVKLGEVPARDRRLHPPSQRGIGQGPSREATEEATRVGVEHEGGPTERIGENRVGRLRPDPGDGDEPLARVLASGQGGEIPVELALDEGEKGEKAPRLDTGKAARPERLDEGGEG
jgi:hypothetical protein